MPRSTNKVASRQQRKKVLDRAKGFWGARSKVFTIAKNSVEKALVHSYRDRKTKKRIYRNLWIVRINAAARENGVSYSKLIDAMNKKGIEINRKVLASLAVESPNVFADIVKFALN